MRKLHNGVLSELFEMLTGVRQGCLLSPFLFLLSIDWIMRRTTEANRDGIQWTLTTRLQDLDVADDIALLSHNHQGMQAKVTRVAKISAKTGLRINKFKTKVTSVTTRNVDNIKLDGKAIDEVEDFTYLGSNISKNGRNILARIGKEGKNCFCNTEACMEINGDIQKDQVKDIQHHVKSVLLQRHGGQPKKPPENCSPLSTDA